MKLLTLTPRQSLLLALLSLGSLVAACKDDDPCDPDQTERNTQCYPTAGKAGAAGKAGSATGGADAVGGGAGGAADATAGGPTAVDTPFGSPCEDTTESSDCGGEAPLCGDLTPLGQPVMCTQKDCAEGEANAGACPSGFTCFAVPGYPSVCIKE